MNHQFPQYVGPIGGGAYYGMPNNMLNAAEEAAFDFRFALPGRGYGWHYPNRAQRMLALRAAQRFARGRFARNVLAPRARAARARARRRQRLNATRTMRHFNMPSRVTRHVASFL